MLDIKIIRNDPKAVEVRLKTKDPKVNLKPILALDEAVRLLKTEVEDIKNKRNLLSKEIGEKKRKGEDTSDLMKDVGGLGEKTAEIDKQLHEKETELNNLLARLPNLPDEKVKVSQKVEDNVVLRTFGKKPSFSFEPKNHVELNEKLHLFDFKRAAKTSGSNWPAYCGNGAKLEWALLNYMLDFHQENDFQFWLPPLLVRPELAYGAAQLPKFEHQQFKIHDEDYELYLIPTSEVALLGLHNNEILDGDNLPLKYVSYTPCFRREAGGLGASERGLIRMHQFNKVEMFAFTTPEQSETIYNEMLSSAEALIKGLGLHFQTTELVTGDMSFPASKTIDLEVWLPGQNRYYEVSSVSNCSDFQARRSHTRFKHGQDKPQLCHTLNGSGLATSRLMVALLENNQREDGCVEIPLVLHKYLNGMKELTPT
ncbi:MAG: serine--tRNA ligase [Simkaniaceae bacterium]|nr:serine--tRNA ligase [Candidatus Sacchlamyda saccharinae]